MVEETFQIELIPDEDFVYRQVPVLALPKIDNKRVPNEANFIPDNDGLSVNWDKYCDEDTCYKLLGLTYNNKQQFINITVFKLIKLNVGYVRNIEGIQGVIHDPKIEESKGSPKNWGHSLIVYKNDEEVRLKLADYCRENNLICPKPNFSNLNKEIDELKARLD